MQVHTMFLFLLCNSLLTEQVIAWSPLVPTVPLLTINDVLRNNNDCVHEAEHWNPHLARDLCERARKDSHKVARRLKAFISSREVQEYDHYTRSKGGDSKAGEVIQYHRILLECFDDVVIPIIEENLLAVTAKAKSLKEKGISAKQQPVYEDGYLGACTVKACRLHKDGHDGSDGPKNPEEHARHAAADRLEYFTDDMCQGLTIPIPPVGGRRAVPSSSALQHSSSDILNMPDTEMSTVIFTSCILCGVFISTLHALIVGCHLVGQARCDSFIKDNQAVSKNPLLA